MLTVGSLFAGVGGFDLGMERAGFKVLWQAEWDKHCQSVLRRHWPDSTLYGDVTDVNGAKIAPVNVITFGSPCQDLSVAGKRAGLHGDRSSMFFQAIRIIKEMRNATNGVFPQIAIWENVPGALNTNKGADFGVVLDALANLGAVAIEWAVLDAQQFGVPQRRRRVFVVAVFDPAVAERCPDPLLPVGEGRRRDSAKGKPKGKNVATSLADRTGSSSGNWAVAAQPLVYDGYNQDLDDSGVHRTLRIGRDSSDFVAQPIIFEPGAMSRLAAPGFSTDVASTLRAHMGDNQLAVAQPIPIDDRREIEKHQNGLGIADEGAPAYTLDTRSAASVAQPVVAPSLTAANNPSRSPQSSEVTEQVGAVFASQYAVRRLTPLECERLMGWPDDHTRWTDNGREQADSHRYRQCGNGVASPVAAWIGQQIMSLLDQPS